MAANTALNNRVGRLAPSASPGTVGSLCVCDAAAGTTSDYIDERYDDEIDALNVVDNDDPRTPMSSQSVGAGLLDQCQRC